MSGQPPYPSYPGAEPPHQPAVPGYQPPPAWGQAHGQAPPPGPGYPPGLPTQRPMGYAGWGLRVGGYLLDAVFLNLVALVLGVILGIVLAAGGSDVATSDQWGAVDLASYGISFTLAFLNFAVLQGITGQSLGKMVVGTRVITESTGEPTGILLGLGRMLLLGILTVVTLGVNFLWPLWDEKNQTLHDKVASTVVVR